MRSLCIVLVTTACNAELASTPDAGSEPDVVTCPATRTYTSLGGSALEADRIVLDAGRDRLRLKPFTALSIEFRRGLGLAAFDTSAYAATFGRPPARWYTEPTANASTVYGAFALAFAACTQHVATAATYASAPDVTSASAVCSDLAHRAWDREASTDEVAACVDYVVTKTPAADAPRRRWAYGCAAVFSAAEFLSY